MRAEFFMDAVGLSQANDQYEHPRLPQVTMRILSLMAGRDEFVNHRSLSVAEAARHLGVTLEDARSRLRHPRAQSEFVHLVMQRNKPTQGR